MQCFRCGSLLYAQLDQIGSTIKCHDCHSENLVKPPRPEDVQKAYDGPTLDDAEDFALSPTFERPNFEAIEIPRPPDEADGNEFSNKPQPVKPTPSTSAPPAKPGADGAMVDLFSLHGAPPAGNAATTSPATAPANSASFKPPPTSPPSPHSNPPTPLPPIGSIPSKPPRIRMHADSYGDELWSPPTDTSRPTFERGPFVVGIVEFLLYPGTLVRWLTLVALASVPIAVLEMTAATVGQFGSLFSGSALVLLFFAAVLGIPWLAVFGAHAMAIVADTGRGRDAIEEWPMGGFVPRGNPLYLPISFVAGMLPGLLVFALYYLSREEASIRGPLMLLVSAMLFTPLAWLPMLLEKSLQGPLYSQTFWQSFRFSGDGWFVFYFETLLLCLFAAGGMSLWSYGSVILAPLSALLLVTPLILYFRLVGRMLWYIDPEMAPPQPEAAKAAPAPLPETVDPSQLRR